MKHGLNTDFQNHCGMDDWRERTRLACGFGRRPRSIGGTIQFGKRFSARRRKRQPGRARSPAKSQPCGQWQFGVDEWGKRVLNLKNMPTTLKLKFMGDGTAFNSHRAWIVLGDHAIDNGEHLLSADCVTASQVEEAAQYLKKQ